MKFIRTDVISVNSGIWDMTIDKDMTYLLNIITSSK